VSVWGPPHRGAPPNDHRDAPVLPAEDEIVNDMDSRSIEVEGAVLHVGLTGGGPDVVALSGGPGCVQYLERDEISPPGYRVWYPEPRGVGRSSGGPHTMAQAIRDLESIRRTIGLARWIVLGHSWGCDLAVRYAAEHPEAVEAVIGIAGRGPQRDRTWSEAYESGKTTETVIDIAWVPEVHAALSESFTEWIHESELWRKLADCHVPMQFIVAGDDIRPSWPLRQLAALLPQGTLSVVPGVPHDFWATHPETWTAAVKEACARYAHATHSGG
jgi:proline iminopeptidase